jgi:predicted RNA-binding protein associated with RNAse of E/G family
VNDKCNKEIVEELSKNGVKLIILRFKKKNFFLNVKHENNKKKMIDVQDLTM